MLHPVGFCNTPGNREIPVSFDPFIDGTCHQADITPLPQQLYEKMEEGAAVLSPAHRDPDTVARNDPAVLPDRTFGLGFKISHKMRPAEVETGVTLGDDGGTPAPAAGYVWQSDQPLFPV
jgi:hypothetical protein